jgi:hypothetical protein
MSARPHFACCCLLRLLTGRDPGIESTLSHTPLPPREKNTQRRTSKWVKITTRRGKGNGSLVFWGLEKNIRSFSIWKKKQTTISASTIGENSIQLGKYYNQKRPPRLTCTYFSFTITIPTPFSGSCLFFLLQFHFLPLYISGVKGGCARVDLQSCDEFRNGADGSTTETRIE